ncbi:CASP-like protein 1C1 [Herrania umbratica]|uniref:CASP-like protein n=1 Tax=Herrania umbratica TaxID=108875 RepID=A0A6J0ZRK4_9ROSI|nr:CASP-like protein 1C1 [Herrania umbratica]
MSDAEPSALFRTKCTLALRVLAALASLVAAIAMGISHETVPLPSLHSIKIEAKDVSCFMYFMGINSIVSAYSFLVLLLPKTSLLWRSIVASDMVAAMLLASINSATLGMFYMEMKGNTHAQWSPICDLVSSYCTRVLTAVTAGYIALGMYFFNIIFCLCMALNPLLLQAPKKEPPPPKK